MKITLIIFLFIPIILFGQSKELSLGIHSLNYKRAIIDTSINYFDKVSYLTNLNYTMGYTHIFNNSKFIELNVGFSPLHSNQKINKKLNDGTIDFIQTESRKQTDYSYYNYINYGFINTFDKLEIRSSSVFLFQYYKVGNYYYNQDNTDLSGNVGSYYHLKQTSGYYLNYGIYLKESFVLPLYKKFIIAADFNIGYNLSNFYGANSRYVEKLNNNKTEISSETYDYKISRIYSFNFFPSFSLRYKLGK